MTFPQPTVELPDDPSLSPIPSPRPSLPGMFFSGADNATPVPEPATDPETGAPLPSQLDDPGDAWASDGPLSDDVLSGQHDDPATSTASPAGKPLSRAAARQTARAAVLTAGGMAHRFLAQTEGQRQVQLYLADEDDATAIGDPLGNIAHRHSSAIGAAANPDVADGLQAILGLFGYVSKQIVATAQAKRIDGGEQLPARDV